MKIFSFIFSLLSFVMAGASLWRIESSDAGDRSGLIDRVEAALHEKPEMILSAIESLSKKMSDGKMVEPSAQAVENEKAVMENADALFNDEDDPTAGSPDGDIRVVEFLDYRCGYCRHAYGNIHEAAQKDGNVKLIYKEYPIFSSESLQAKAALAAHMQGRYNDFHKALMSSNGHWDMEQLTSVAEKLGLDVERWKDDIKNERIEETLNKHKELGKTLGINSTPAFVIEGEIMPGALSVEQFVEVFKSIREKKA